MRQNVFMKYILKTPIRNILLGILIGASSFMLVSQVVEYAIVRSEIERVEHFYRSIGFINNIDGTDFRDVDVGLATKIVGNSHYIDFEDRQTDYFASLKDFQNTEDYGWEPHNLIHPDFLLPQVADAFIYGELLCKKASIIDDEFGVALRLLVDNKLTGYQEHVAVGEEVVLYAILPIEMESTFDDMVIGQRYFLKGTYYRFMWHQGVLVPRGVGILHTEPYQLHIKPFGSKQLWYYPAPAGEELDLEALGVTAEISIVKENQHGMILRTTADMTAIPLVQIDVYRKLEGRLLDRCDDLNRNQVAVVEVAFATKRELSVGDTLNLTLRDLPFVDVSGIPLYLYDWEAYPSYELELEIVGFYNRVLGGLFSSRYIYVPESIIPSEFVRENDSIYGHRYSFVLTSTRHQEAFLEKYGEELLEFGFEVTFFDHNAEMMWSIVNPIIQGARINIIVFGGIFILILALVATIILFIWRRFYGILRALGCPVRLGFIKMFYAIIIIFFGPMFLGTVLARQVAITSANETMESILEIAPNVELSSYFPIGYIIGIWLLLAIIGLIIFSLGALLIVKQPVIILLQGGYGNVNVNREKEKNSGEKALPKEIDSLELDKGERLRFGDKGSGIRGNEFVTHPKYSKMAMRRNTFRHIYRKSLKSVLVVTLALSLVIVIGLLSEAIEQREKEIDYFYDNIVVSAQVRRADTANLAALFVDPFNIVNHRIVNSILDTGFVKSTYLEAGKREAFLLSANCNKELFDGRVADMSDSFGDYNRLFAFDDFAIFMYEYREWIINLPIELGIPMVEDLNIRGVLDEETLIQFEFGSEFNESDFYFSSGKDGESFIPIIVGENVMEERGLNIGDSAYIANVLTRELYQARVIGVARGVMHGGMLFEIFNGSNMTFMPVAGLETVQGNRIDQYIKALFELDPTKNREISYFREDFEEIGRQMFTLNFDLGDDELRKVVEPIEETLLLLRILYPIVIVLSLLIGVGFAVLLSLQNAKEAAIMVVLGMKKSKVRKMLILMQILLCTAGLLIGQVLFVIITDSSEAYIWSILFAVLYFIATLIGSIVGAITVTNRSPLELLQVRE